MYAICALGKFRNIIQTHTNSYKVQWVLNAKPSRKSLHFPTTTDEAQQIKDSIDDLLTDGSLEVKVVIVDGTGKPTARIPQDVESKQKVRQVCNKNWQAAANTILRHNELKPDVVKSLKKNVSEEVASYLKSESMKSRALI